MMIGRAYLPRWFLLFLALMAGSLVLRTVTRPLPAWQAVLGGVVLLLVLPVALAREGSLLVRNSALPRRIPVDDVVSTHVVGAPWWAGEGSRIALRLRDGSEVPVNALSHLGLWRRPSAPPSHLLAAVERLGLPAVAPVGEPAARRHESG